MFASGITIFWIARYQHVVANYVREPSEESKAKAHAYQGYPTPTFRQPLIDAADAWYERHVSLNAELERLKQQQFLHKDTTLKALTAIVEQVKPAIDHDADAKRSLLTQAIALVEDGNRHASWQKELAAIQGGWRLQSGTQLVPVSFNPITSTAIARCLARDGTVVGKLSSVDFQVLDSQGQLWPHFSVTEQDRSFSNASVVVLIDRSISMEGEPMEQLKAGLDKVLEVVTEETRMQLVAFDHMVQTLTPFTNNRAVLQEAVKSLQPKGATAIADAANYAIGVLQLQPGVKSILLCTDGQDEKLRAGITTIVARCVESNIIVNVLAIDHAQLDRATLEELSSNTNGCLAYAGQPKEIISQLDAIVNNCKPSYQVKIFAANRPSNSFSIRLRNAPDQIMQLD